MATRAYTIADLHFDHPNNAKLRGFDNSSLHDEMIVDSVNSTVNPTDYLYLLGDIVIGKAGWEIIKGIVCRNIILVPGNHCGERSRIQHDFFNRVIGTYARRLPGSRIGAIFTHIPVHPDCLDRWTVNVHGHLHKQSIADDRYLCVSAEQLNYRPICMETITEIFLSRGIHGKDKAPL